MKYHLLLVFLLLLSIEQAQSQYSCSNRPDGKCTQCDCIPDCFDMSDETNCTNGTSIESLLRPQYLTMVLPTDDDVGTNSRFFPPPPLPPFPLCPDFPSPIPTLTHSTTPIPPTTPTTMDSQTIQAGMQSTRQLGTLPTPPPSTQSTREAATLPAPPPSTQSTRPQSTLPTPPPSTQSTRAAGTRPPRQESTESTKQFGTQSIRQVGTRQTRQDSTESTRPRGTHQTPPLSTQPTKQFGTQSTRRDSPPIKPNHVTAPTTVWTTIPATKGWATQRPRYTLSRWLCGEFIREYYTRCRFVITDYCRYLVMALRLCTREKTPTSTTTTTTLPPPIFPTVYASAGLSV